MNLEAMLIHHCTAYLGITAQCKVCQFFLFAGLKCMQQTIHTEKI